MKEEIVQLTAEDFEEAMDFLNLVFGQHRPHDFERLLPALYRPDDERMACNHAVREGGKIRAIVGLFPVTWQVGDTLLKVGGIGGVSTHPKRRGRGYMKVLMNHCVEKMRREGYHLSYLGGQRQRYQYFGYERCGSAFSLSLTRTNLRHGFTDDPGIRFEPLEADDQEKLSRARKLHDAQEMHCIRSPEAFHYHLLNWYGRPFAAFDEKGRMVGYLVVHGEEYVAELAAEDDDTALRMMRAWVAGHAGTARIDLPAVRAGLVRLLGRCGDQVGVHATGNWQIFDWARLLDALLKMRRTVGPMAKGAVVAGIEGYGKVRMEVEDDWTGCVRTEEEPDVRCDPFTAMRALFGPAPPSLVLELPSKAAILEQWCPLPLHWPRQDGV